jgi:hypothetical protein
VSSSCLGRWGSSVNACAHINICKVVLFFGTMVVPMAGLVGVFDLIYTLEVHRWKIAKPISRACA